MKTSALDNLQRAGASRPHKARPLRPAATFGRYRLLEPIGAGGMAEIFRAEHVGVHGFVRRVALKRLRIDVADAPEAARLFADEARVSARLQHPNIVQVIDFGAAEGQPFMVMELLDGQNLAEVTTALRRRGERLGTGLAVFVAREIARALAYAHNLCDEADRPLDIVHRDISPTNIMLIRAGAVKLVDFGIARVEDELRLAGTAASAMRGKASYMAPERILGRDVDGRTDIFALGVVLWEMLTAQRLFVGASTDEILAKIMTSEIPPPSALVPEIDPALDRVVLCALAHDPESRYRTAEAMMRDLEALMRAFPVRHGDLSALLARLHERADPATCPIALPPGGFDPERAAAPVAAPEADSAELTIPVPPPSAAAEAPPAAGRNEELETVRVRHLAATDTSRDDVPTSAITTIARPWGRRARWPAALSWLVAGALPAALLMGAFDSGRRAGQPVVAGPPDQAARAEALRNAARRPSPGQRGPMPVGVPGVGWAPGSTTAAAEALVCRNPSPAAPAVATAARANDQPATPSPPSPAAETPTTVSAPPSPAAGTPTTVTAFNEAPLGALAAAGGATRATTLSDRLRRFDEAAAPAAERARRPPTPNERARRGLGRLASERLPRTRLRPGGPSVSHATGRAAVPPGALVGTLDPFTE